MDTDDIPAEDTEAPDPSPAREAQAQRARRREAEEARDAAVAERDAMAERITRLQRADAERLAGAVLADPSDLWLVGGVDLADLIDADDGDLDADAVTAACEAIVATRGQRFARTTHAGAAWDGGARQAPPKAAPGWAEVLYAQAQR